MVGSKRRREEEDLLNYVLPNRVRNPVCYVQCAEISIRLIMASAMLTGVVVGEMNSSMVQVVVNR